MTTFEPTANVIDRLSPFMNSTTFKKLLQPPKVQGDAFSAEKMAATIFPDRDSRCPSKLFKTLL